MPILIPCHKLAYFPIPKVACTSLKHTVFEINNGFYIRSPDDDSLPKKKMVRKCPIHLLYKTTKYSLARHSELSDYKSFAVIRDPMQRILSGYSNRVLYHRALKKRPIVAALVKKNLPLDPDINQFVMNLEKYRKVSSEILSHTRPLRYFLGKDLSRFDKIFTIQQLPEVANYLSQAVGRNINIPRFQTGGDKQSLSMLDDEAFNKLRELCRPDYLIAQDYLTIPER
jgi:hypothetical protein